MAKDIHDLRIRIIGAGMGGLGCALALAQAGFKDIQVFENATDLGFVGAGIQLAPNMARILDRFGVWKDIEKEAVLINRTSIRQGPTGAELASVDLQGIEALYDYPHAVGHRSSLAGGLYEGCKLQPSIRFIFSTRAENVRDFLTTPTFTAVPRDGSPAYDVAADILLGADGVKSGTRGSMLEQLHVEGQVKDTGQAAYRIMLRREQFEHDPELLELIDSNRVTRWIGEKKHIIAYPVANKTVYNLSTAQPDTNFAAAPSETYTTRGSKEAMLRVYSDFCPMVQRMLNLVPEGEVCEWKLRVHAPLPSWVHGKVCLVGDACHPTLPHLNQGAAQALEDAAVIGRALAHLPDGSPESINKALRVYEALRKTRAETLVDLAAQSGKELQLGEGEAKRQRDEQFAALAANGTGPVPDRWADADVQKMIFGFDCTKTTDAAFAEIFDKLKAVV